jgi:selenide,water dikinase
LGPGDLNKIVKDIVFKKNSSVIVGFENSEDAGIYKLPSGECIVQTADFITPVVDDPYMYGRIAAANSLSDIFAMGGKPITALNLVCFDSCNLDSEDLKQILQGGLDAVTKSGAVVLGGHTIEDSEMKFGLSVTGIVKKENITLNSGAKIGDDLILTKPIGLGIVTTANKADMASKKVMQQATEIMAKLNKTASEIMVQLEVKGATDITGFGLLGHTLEMAKASNVSIVLNEAEIPFLEEALYLASIGMIPAGSYRNRQFCEPFVKFQKEISDDKKMILFDAQTSGGLLIAVSNDKTEQFLKLLNASGEIWAKKIGFVKNKSDKYIYIL